MARRRGVPTPGCGEGSVTSTGMRSLPLAASPEGIPVVVPETQTCLCGCTGSAESRQPDSEAMREHALVPGGRDVAEPEALFELLTWLASVAGSPVEPLNTSTATGIPVVVVVVSTPLRREIPSSRGVLALPDARHPLRLRQVVMPSGA